MKEVVDMKIRKITPADKHSLYKMMRVFYDSPALIHKSSDRVLMQNIDAALSEECPFLEAYIFEAGIESEDREELIGYSMISKSFTTEYGGICIWVEDLYFEKNVRGKGYAGFFFDFLEEQYPEAVRFKLEVEQENEYAVKAYKKKGYETSDYFLMTKEIDKDEFVN